MKTFILIDLRTSGNKNISFSHYYYTFAVKTCFHADTLKLAPIFSLEVRSDLYT